MVPKKCGDKVWGEWTLLRQGKWMKHSLPATARMGRAVVRSIWLRWVCAGRDEKRVMARFIDSRTTWLQRGMVPAY